MLSRLTGAVLRRPRVTLAVIVAVLGIQIVYGAGVFSRLSVGGFHAAADESTRAETVLDHDFRLGAPNLVLLVHASGKIDDPAVAAQGAALTRRLAAEPGVSAASSYWTSGLPALRDKAGDAALVVARISGSEDQRKATLLRIFPHYQGDRDGLRVSFGGQLAAEREVTNRSRDDLRRMEMMATPLVAVLLLLVFGSPLASLFSLVIGGMALVGVTFALRLITEFTSVSTYALNIATALSLGLAVDYGLFMISRYREEVARGAAPAEATVRMIQTAGRTVLFSALTVAMCLSSLLVIPLYYFRSIALAAIAVVLSAALSAVVVMPALLGLFGRHVDRWNVYRGLRRLRGGDRSEGATGGGWRRFATFVMRRPAPLTVVSLALLGVCMLPALHVRFGLPDVTALPAPSEPVRVTATLDADFPDLATDAMYAVSTGGPLSDARTAQLARDISALPAVRHVESAVGVYRDGALATGPNAYTASFRSPVSSYLNVVLDTPAQSPRAVELVRAVRRLGAPDHLLVGGNSAHLVDTEHTIGSRLPVVVAILGGSTLLLLLLFSGSVLVAIEAMMLNLLSIAATFGMLVYVFQDGHLRWLVGDFQTSGNLELTTPILLLATAFGLSMDYEIFVVARIREEYDATGDNNRAVVVGLQRSGRVITLAALLFVVVMVAFAGSSLSLVKLVGVGLAFAVVLDVTVVRAVLVPALMRLAGRANWWAPAWLRALHSRVARLESASPPPMAAAPPAAEPDPVSGHR